MLYEELYEELAGHPKTPLATLGGISIYSGGLWDTQFAGVKYRQIFGILACKIVKYLAKIIASTPVILGLQII